MKVASYLATQAGIEGFTNRLIRWRFAGSFFKDGEASHTEVVFEPGDGVDHLMPDGTTQPDADGAYWCASAVSFERLPAWSHRRAGKIGGIRFKRIRLEPERWEVKPYKHCAKTAAIWFLGHEGAAYDWGQILGFIYWPVACLFPQKEGRWTCSAATAACVGYTRPELFHPAIVRAMVSQHR